MSLIKWKNDALFPTFNTIWDDFFNRDYLSKGLDLGTNIPAVNIVETEANYNIEVAVPGFSKEDFDIQIDNGILTVSSEKEEKKEEKEGEKITRTEFNYSSFQRSFQLPEDIKKSDILAEYKDGLLKLTLPKSEPSKIEDKKKIEVS